MQVAVDYDKDGRFDATETVYIYDLQVARERSQQRRSNQQRQVGRRNLDRSATDRSRRSQQSHQVQGQIHDLRKIQMHDGDGPFVVARIKTEHGRTARVLLGREDQLSQLDLRDGKQVQVTGRLARVNDQPVLLATRVGTGNQQVRVQSKRLGPQVKMYEGKILRTRAAQFRGYEDSFVLAVMRTDDGKRQLVNLGPKSKIGNIKWQEVDQVRLLACPGTVNGRRALAAEQINVDGRTIKIEPDKKRDRQWQNQESRNSEAGNRQGNG